MNLPFSTPLLIFIHIPQYVAVTGLPEPQIDHAAICVRFARDCMHKFRQLTAEMVDKFGEDTADLEMRVGLHSGPGM